MQTVPRVLDESPSSQPMLSSSVTLWYGNTELTSSDAYLMTKKVVTRFPERFFGVKTLKSTLSAL